MNRLLILFSLLLYPLGFSHATTIIKEYPHIFPAGGIVFQGDSVWVGAHEKGIVLLNTKTDSFRVFDTRDGLLNLEITGVARDLKGNIWVGTTAGINVYRNGEWGNYTYANGVLIGKVTTLINDSQGNIWFATLETKSGTNSRIFKYDGATWTKVGEFLNISYPIWHIAVDLNGALWWGMETENLYRYQDGKWKTFGYYPLNLGESISIDPVGNMWFCGREYQGNSPLRLLKYDIKTQAFSKYRDPRVEGSVYGYYWISSIAVTETGMVWCASPYATSVFDGKYWRGPGLDSEDPRRTNYCKIDSHNRVWFFSEDLFYVDGNDIPKEYWTEYLGVSEDAPFQYPLLRNTPNPFNPSTTISFTLPAPSRATLAVYSLTGQKVRTLVSERMTAGSHSVVWDGRDERGVPVSSGVYLSRLEAGKAVSTTKMLLMK